MRAKRWSALLLSGVMTASMLTGCGMNKNETVATFDETEVPLGVANFAARFLQATYDDFYVAYFGEDVWSSDLYNNGTTMQDNIKDSVMQSLFDMYTLEAHMAEYDVMTRRRSQTQRLRLLQTTARTRWMHSVRMRRSWSVI